MHISRKLSEQAQHEIEMIVKGAIGFNKERGDEVTIITDEKTTNPPIYTDISGVIGSSNKK